MNRVDAVIKGKCTLSDVEREFWRGKYTCRALEALANERGTSFDTQRELYDPLLHLSAWYKATTCFKRTTAPKECPTSFKQFIESKCCTIYSNLHYVMFVVYIICVC